jgi:hypothetical protein
MSISPSNKYVRLGLISLFAAGIIGYALFQTRNLIQGPIIKIHSPVNGSSLTKSFVEIEGAAKNISYINLNDRQIFTDESGAFSERLLLSYGYNIITLRARDKFGREVEKTLELVYK